MKASRWRAAAIIAAMTISGACAGSDEPAGLTFVGGDTCATCHQAEAAAWAGSHHDLAMQLPGESTVLGDFDNATFDYFGRTSTFYREGSRFMVRTDGPDGTLQDYPIAYTFGADPLQQYLVEFPGGKYQVLGTAWDARPAADGGQRWYHLYPDEDIAAGDRLHWTGPEQRWNYQCAACHSTDLDKGYDVATDSYDTTWSDLNVSCEACHGPGSAHVEWVNSGAATAIDSTEAETGPFGLAIDLSDRDGGQWAFPEGLDIARREPPRTADPMIGTCAPCHSRRSLITGSTTPVVEPLDAIRPSLLDPPLYHADGQILDEVYVYGSFVQSAMHTNGVTCKDCHDPHTTRTRETGNGLCTRCHTPATYDAQSHHGHQSGSTGSACVSCHMPTRTYMGVDARRDHSLRVPRPDLSETLGTPNACMACHQNQSAAWAAAAVVSWHGPVRTPTYDDVLAAGRVGDTMDTELSRLALDRTQPGIVRASALTLLASHRTDEAAVTARTGILDPDPMVRFGGVIASETLPLDERYGVLSSLLDDPVRLVRLEAARVLASVPSQFIGDPARLDAVIDDYIEAQRLSDDRAESHFNIGLVQADRGRPTEAEAALRRAIRLDPAFVPAYVNLAELYRGQGRDAAAEAPLRDAVRASNGAGLARHALGLWLVRQNRADEALPEFEAAALETPEDARVAYVYGVALHSTGEVAEAIEFLEGANTRHPRDEQVLSALVAFNRDAGRIDEAIRHARRWLELSPDDPRLRTLLDELIRIKGDVP